jgi:hypothetical protein
MFFLDEILDDNSSYTKFEILKLIQNNIDGSKTSKEKKEQGH